MATAADTNSSQANLPVLQSTARALVTGLSWGSLVLIVFGFWMRSKYAGRAPIVSNIFLLTGLAAAGLAVWQAFTLWFKKDTPAEKAGTLEQQRGLFAYILIGAGLGLIILAFALFFDKKAGANWAMERDNFAETFGCMILGLIALAGGYLLQQPLGVNVSPIQFLVDKVHTLKLAPMVLGVACMIGFVYIVWKNSLNNRFLDWWPELAALLFMSMLCLSCLLWLNTGQFDEFGIRLFVLVFGGTTGVILFFMILSRAYLWRQDIIMGGIASWQGQHAWRFWLCAYVLFAALVLMFVSFNLARADIRKNVALRRVMYGYDALVQAFLLIGILVILNIVVYALIPFTFDWTKSRGAYALATASKNLLGFGLKQEAHILVLLPQNSDVYKDVRNLMDNCQAAASRDRLKVEYISPDVNQLEYAHLVQLFPSILPDLGIQGAGRGILIVYGPMPTDEKHTTPHSFVPEKKLFDDSGMRPQQRGEKAKFVFKGEGEILKELKFLVEGRTKLKVYVLQGNDEADMRNDDRDTRQEFRHGFDMIGIGGLTDRLTMDNYDVAGLSFNALKLGEKNPPNFVFAKEVGPDKRKDVPADCHTLVIAGVTKPLSKDILNAIERFMDQRNGKMIVFFDVVADAAFSKLENSGLEALLKRYGVEVTDEFLLRMPDRPGMDPRTLLARTPPKSENTLAREFPDRGLNMRMSARIVRPAESPRYKAQTILQVDPGQRAPVFAEKNVEVLNKLVPYLVDLARDPVKLDMKAIKAPASVAVAVRDSDGDKPRLVVFGDTEMITNYDLVLSQRDPRAINYSLTLSAIGWMAERDDMGTQPDPHTNYSLPEGVDSLRMVLLPGWLMLLTLIGLGVGFWIVRRR